jgi:hypothetical protein
MTARADAGLHRQRWRCRPAEKERLLAMTPASYTGMAAELARRIG